MVIVAFRGWIYDQVSCQARVLSTGLVWTVSKSAGTYFGQTRWKTSGRGSEKRQLRTLDGWIHNGADVPVVRERSYVQYSKKLLFVSVEVSRATRH